MIFKQDDIAIFSHVDGGDLNKIKVTRFHKPTGVYFAAISGDRDISYTEVELKDYYYYSDVQVYKNDTKADYLKATNFPTDKIYEIKYYADSLDEAI